MNSRIYALLFLITLAASPALAQEAPRARAGEIQVFNTLLARGYTYAGQRAAYTCGMCHSFEEDGPDTPAPNLWDIVGSPRARSPHFHYSPALEAMHEQRWTYEALNDFLRNPQQFAPGTSMSFAGVSNVRVRASLIAWLRALSEHPQPLPSPPAK